MIKGSIQEEDITIVNIYEPNIGAPQYIRQMLTAIKGEMDSNTIIVGDFNTPLSPMDRSSKMKINKEGFPGGAVVGSPPANAGVTGSSPGPGRSHMPQGN